MFGWFKKKSAGANPYQPVNLDPQKDAAEDTPKEPTVINDWEPRHGAWFKGTFCHCGRQCQGTPSQSAALILARGVCPKCGHEDKWETFTARWEWEHSQTIRTDWFRTGCFSHYTEERKQPWSRNAKLVRWTEDHCKIDEEKK